MATTLGVEEVQTLLHRLTMHWGEVEGEIGRSFTLLGSYDRSHLGSEANILAQAIAALAQPENDAERAASQREILRSPLLLRFDQVKNAVVSTLADTPHRAALPRKPSPNASAAVTLKAFSDLSELWGKIDTDTKIPAPERPLRVVSGYGKAEFDTDREALRLAFVEVDDSRRRATQARKDRDVLLPPLRKRLSQYRARVKSLLPAGHRLLATLP